MTISNMNRAMLLHVSAHWKHGIDATMWPMAVKYATYVYNTIPRTNHIAPSDLFFGATLPRHKLQNMHVWGCPVYVLSPILQSGNKIPCWEPRSKRGVFCGLSTIHSSEVPQILNLTTGSITTQFHVVFDDLFSTVPPVEREEEHQSHWNDMCLEQTEFIPLDTQLLCRQNGWLNLIQHRLVEWKFDPTGSEMICTELDTTLGIMIHFSYRIQIQIYLLIEHQTFQLQRKLIH